METVRTRTSVGWLIGLLSAAVTVGVGELVAAFVRPEASPVIAVGNRVVLLTPESAKRATIDSVGTADKTLLLGSIYLLLALLGAGLGTVALSNLRAGVAGVLLIGIFGSYCALTANASRASDVVPTVIGTLTGAAVLVALIRMVRARDATAADDAAGPDRRRFLIGAGAAAALAAVAGFGGRATQHARFDVAAARRKVALPAAVGSGVPRGAELGRSGVAWATPTSSFYRIDTALTVPQIDPDTWRLRIHGMVDRELTLSYAQVLARPQLERWITLSCVSNDVGGQLVGNALFQGVRLADLLKECGVQSGADQLLLTSADGYTFGAPAAAVMDGRDALLAVGMNGEPLPLEHGFPVRTVVPGLYGYVSACKWITSIEATTFANQSAYWVQEGWVPKPTIKLASRIDTPRTQKTLTAGATVSVAGVAWDQHVGVSRVEVQVDGGPWQSARLAAVPSTDTWRQWVLPWTPDRTGTHRLRVRAFDGAGVAQDEQHRAPFPSGATGLHTITVHVTA
jgi:DMSO/TMAO reductase YedYZ molybdopterin-dependent catalytic subunit